MSQPLTQAAAMLSWPIAAHVLSSSIQLFFFSSFSFNNRQAACLVVVQLVMLTGQKHCPVYWLLVASDPCQILTCMALQNMNSCSISFRQCLCVQGLYWVACKLSGICPSFAGVLESASWQTPLDCMQAGALQLSACKLSSMCLSFAGVLVAAS